MYIIGDVIELDCGYGPHENIQKCTIIGVDACFNVWHEPIWSIKIRAACGDVFNTDKPRDANEQIRYKNDFYMYLKYIKEKINPWRIQNDLDELTEEQAKECFDIISKVNNGK